MEEERESFSISPIGLAKRSEELLKETCYLKRIFKQKEENLEDWEKKVFTKLVLPRQQELKPSLAEFGINEKKIREDQRKVIRLIDGVFSKPRFNLEGSTNYLKAKIAEALLSKIVEGYYITSHFYFTDTSVYDDWENGVDIVLEYEPDPSKSGAIDLTISADNEKLKDKIFKILDLIKEGSLVSVDYFIPQSNFNARTSLKMVPIVILAVNYSTIRELGIIYTQEKEKRKKLEDHWSKYSIFHQIIIQLKAYKEYAEKLLSKRGQNREVIEKIIEKYNDLHNNLSSLEENPLKDLEKSARVLEEAKRRDISYCSLISVMNLYFPQIK